MLFPDHVSTIICINTSPIKYSTKINRICCENRAYFLFHTKIKRSQLAFKLKRVFDVSITVKYSYHFPGGLLVELQWHVNQNKIAVGFLKDGSHDPILVQLSFQIFLCMMKMLAFTQSNFPSNYFVMYSRETRQFLF